MLRHHTPSTCIGTITFIVALFLPWHASARVVISEVMWPGSPLSTADEWVEIMCEGAEVTQGAEVCPTDIGGWSILSRNSSGQDALMIRFATGTVIHAGQFFLVSNYGAGESVLAIQPDVVTTAVSLPNSNLKLTLIDRTGTVMDIADDGAGTPFAGRSADPRASMERIDLAASGSDPANWKTADASVNFDAGVAIFGTPGVGSLGSLGSSSFASAIFSSSISPSSITSIPITSSIASSDPSSSSSEISSTASSESSSSLPTILTVSSLPPKPSIRISELLPDPPGADDREWIEVQNAGEQPTDITGWKLKRGTASYVVPARSDAMFLVAPSEFRIFYKFESKLSLPNDGGLVELFDASGTLVDAMTYNGSPEGVSTAIDSFGQRKSFCAPTPLRENGSAGFDARIEVQSGLPTDYDSVTLNLQALADGASLGSSVCAWDFGDGNTSDSCNPPSHTWEEKGVYPVKLSVTDACAETVEKTLDVVVLTKKIQKIQTNQMIQKIQTNQMIQKNASSSGSSESSASSHSVAKQNPQSCLPSSSTGIVISAVYPSPNAGEDEWIELRNVSDNSIDLCGWSLDDIADGGSKPWTISGSIVVAANGLQKFFGSQTRLALNNDGDAVRLLNPDGIPVANFAYKNAKTGTVIASEHPIRSKSSSSQNEKKIKEQKIYSKYSAPSLLASVGKALQIRYDVRSASSSSSFADLSQLPDLYRDVFQTASGSEITPQAALRDSATQENASAFLPWIILIAQSIGATLFVLRRMILP